MEREDDFGKRALIAIVLALVVIIGYQYFFMPKPKPGRPVKQALEGEEEQKKPAAETETLFVPSEAEAPGGRLVTVETPLYSAVFSSKGATVKGWRLKKYLDDEGAEVTLLRPGAMPALAMGIGVDGKIVFSSMDFKILQGGESIILENPGQRASLTFLYRSDNLLIKRTFQFQADDYRVDMIEEVQGPSSYWVTLGSGFGISGAEGYRAHTGPVILDDTDRVELKPDKLKKPRVFGERLRWIAQEDKYFFASVVPIEKALGARAWQAENGEVLVALNLPEGENKLLLYAGPKEHDRLKGFGVGLEHIIDFGFFSILARPLFWIMKQSYKVLGNYGLSIIFLTLLIRIPFIPLINKGQRSMKKLQALQPQLNEIKKKYKNDSQRAQKEMMELYKKYKVNPMSGCLPILIQLPVFFALYKVLLIAIELRKAPFVLWIQDLSEKDPYYVLPIVMGITMYIQQKMTPTQPQSSPQQQKLMNYLPVIFTILFLNFPSGLVLYWLVSNILSIIQQYLTNRKLAAETAK